MQHRCDSEMGCLPYPRMPGRVERAPNHSDDRLGPPTRKRGVALGAVGLLAAYLTKPILGVALAMLLAFAPSQAGILRVLSEISILWPSS